MRFPRFSILAATAAVLVAAGGATAIYWLRRPAPLSPELGTPMLALERLAPFQGKRLFFMPAAVPFLKPNWPQWHPAGVDDGAIEAAAQRFDAAALNPKASWRALDRAARFSAVFLSGDPATFRPLLEHLRDSSDWTLTWLDSTSYIFERSPARKWTAADIEPLKARFATHSAAEQVRFRVDTAHRLIAIGENEPAKALLDEALAIDPHSAPVLTELAAFHGALAQWEEALATAERAVAADGRYLPAIAMKTNALYANGKFSDALLLARSLVKKTPEDGQNLALYAQVAHAAHAFKEEIAVLEKIIQLSQAKALPTGTWRVYLAQAYAADSQAEPALAQFEAALKEPDTTDQARAFILKGIEQIKSRKPVF